MHVGALTLHGFTQSGPPRSVIGLRLGNVNREEPVGDIPARALLEPVCKGGRQLSSCRFQTLGRVCFSKQAWWSSLTLLDIFEVDLKRLGLHEVVRATCLGINISIPTFYAIMKM